MLGYPFFRASIVSLAIISFIVVVLSFKLGVYDDFSDILVEAHGLIFDIVIFGILLQLFIIRRDRKERIRRYKDNIEDYNSLKTEESKTIIMSNVKKLLSEGVSDLFLMNSYLPSSTFSHDNFSETMFIESDLNNTRFHGKYNKCSFALADMHESELINCTLKDTLFTETNLRNTTFSHCKVLKGHFYKANLENATFYFCDLKDCFFDKANIKNTKFAFADGLKAENLINCINIEFAILPDGMKEEIEALSKKRHSNS